MSRLVFVMVVLGGLLVWPASGPAVALGVDECEVVGTAAPGDFYDDADEPHPFSMTLRCTNDSSWIQARGTDQVDLQIRLNRYVDLSGTGGNRCEVSWIDYFGWDELVDGGSGIWSYSASYGTLGGAPGPGFYNCKGGNYPNPHLEYFEEMILLDAPTGGYSYVTASTNNITVDPDPGEAGFTASVSCGGWVQGDTVSIDFGDGTSDTGTAGATGTRTFLHVYEQPGDYVISCGDADYSYTVGGDSGCGTLDLFCYGQALVEWAFVPSGGWDNAMGLVYDDMEEAFPFSVAIDLNDSWNLFKTELGLDPNGVSHDVPGPEVCFDDPVYGEGEFCMYLLGGTATDQCPIGETPPCTDNHRAFRYNDYDALDVRYDFQGAPVDVGWKLEAGDIFGWRPWIRNALKVGLYLGLILGIARRAGVMVERTSS